MKIIYIYLIISSFIYAQPQENIAIFNFKTDEISEQNLGWKVAELVRNCFIEIKEYIVIERDQIDYLLYEQKIQVSPYIDDNKAIEYGNILGTNKIVIGSIFESGSKLIVSARFIDIQTGKVLQSKSVEGKYYSELPMLCKKLVYLLCDMKFNENENKLNIIQAYGYGYPPNNCNEKSRRRMMAERAAILDAKRNLIEKIKGIQLDSKTIINDYLTQSDVIYTTISGFINGIEIINTKYFDDGSVIVIVEIDEEILKTMVHDR